MAALMLAYGAKAQVQYTQPYLSSGAKNNNYRDVFWMHGLNGDVNSMLALSEYFGSRYAINSYVPSYISTRGIDYAANQWRMFNFARRTDNFVVTHSMGGLVARYYDQHYTDNRFEGLITMAAPHRGSEFANSFDNGRVKSFFEGVTVNGTEGFREALANISLITSIFYSAAELVTGIQDPFNQIHPAMTSWLAANQSGNAVGMTAMLVMLAQNVAPAFESLNSNNVETQLKRFGAVLTSMAANHVFGPQVNGVHIAKEELKYNGNMMSAINNGAPFHSPHTINLVSRTDGNVGTKLLGSTISAFKLSDMGESSIGKVDEAMLQNFISKLVTASQECSDAYNKVGKLTGLAAIWKFIQLRPLAAISAIKLLNERSTCRNIAAAFDRQKAFWNYTFEQRYQYCLGNKYTTQHTETWGEWVWVGSGRPTPQPGHPPYAIEGQLIQDADIGFVEHPFVDADIEKLLPPAQEQPYPGDDIPYPGDGRWEWREYTRTYTTTHTHPSDGIVIVPSQEAWSDVPKTRQIPITNVDHEKVKRAPETVSAFTKVFSGQYDSFFRLDLK